MDCAGEGVRVSDLIQKLIALLFRSTCVDMTVFYSTLERYEDGDDNHNNFDALVAF